MGGLGGFGALFDPSAAGFIDPVLVAATDGVGTKLKLAGEMDRHNTIGIDLVAMCVNDLVVQGAEPLFFLDYFATGDLDGGRIAGGDAIIGLESSGPHSNGFSLIRQIVGDSRLNYDSPIDFATTSLGDVLLSATRIYVESVISVHRAGLLKGLAHITGGGFSENIARILPANVTAEIDAASWQLPPVFRWLMEHGEIPPNEMVSTFNCGIGMIAIVAAGDVTEAIRMFTESGSPARPIGRIVVRTPQLPVVRLIGLDKAWRS